MSEPSILEIGCIIEKLREQIGCVAQAAFLYGSVARGSHGAHDMDLLLVAAAEDQATIYAAIANIQRGKELLIHPTVVTGRELSSNPFLQELVESATTLWHGVSRKR